MKHQTKNGIIDRNAQKDLPLLTGHLVTAPTNRTDSGRSRRLAVECFLINHEPVTHCTADSSVC